MIRKLRIKFVLVTMSFATAILLCVMTGICAFLIRGIRQENRMTLNFSLRRPSQQAPPGVEVGGEMPEGFQRDPVFVMEIGTNGQVELLYADRIIVDESKLDEIARFIMEAGGDGGELRQYHLRYVVQRREGATLVALMDMRDEIRMTGSIVLTSALMGLFALGVFFAASLMLSRWTLRPVEHSWRQQRRFVSDASHELKTPLTVILANTGILKAHPEDTLKAQMNWVENTEQEALRMKGMVDDLLFLSKSDDAGLKLQIGNVNLSDVADGTALRFESKAYEQGILLQTDITPQVHVRGDKAQIEQVTAILLDNAIKYADKGGTVSLRVQAQGAAARFSVHNKGQIIAKDDQKYLFDRFYRTDDSRSTTGYGLGLSIAKTIVDAHKGKIQVESDETGDTSFSVSLPISR